jgi:uncharacterized protein YyaL (SSP411 family)
MITTGKFLILPAWISVTASNNLSENIRDNAVASTTISWSASKRHFLRKTVLFLADGAEGQKYLGEKNEAIRAMSTIDGKPAAYVCENFTCKAPVTDPKQLSELLN